jgi:4'-phosphopantetheinyl transferase EntD
MILVFPTLSSLFSQYFTTDLKGIEVLYPAELALVERSASKRKTDFSTGRFCARKALEQFGIDHTAILRDSGKQPIWPAGIAGSISHSNQLTGAIVGKSKHVVSVGLDIEKTGGVQLNMWNILFLESEQQFLNSLNEEDRNMYPTLIFSLKESFYKFQYPLTGQFLEFNDVEFNMKDEQINMKVVKEDYKIAYDMENLQFHWTVADQQLITLCYLKV